MSSQKLKLDRSGLKRLNVLQRRLASKEELEQLVKLFTEMRAAEKVSDMAHKKLEALERKLEDRAETYEDNYLHRFVTSRKTTAMKLKLFLSQYGKLTLLADVDGCYNYAIAREAVTKEMATSFNEKFETDIFNGYIDSLRVSGEEA